MRRSSFAAIVLTSIVGVVAVDACTTQQAHSADAVAINLTNAVCSLGEAQPVGQPWVDVVCIIAQNTEQGIAIATATSPIDGGAATSTPIASARTVHLHLTKDQATTILGLRPAVTK